MDDKDGPPPPLHHTLSSKAAPIRSARQPAERSPGGQAMEGSVPARPFLTEVPRLGEAPRGRAFATEGGKTAKVRCLH